MLPTPDLCFDTASVVHTPFSVNHGQFASANYYQFGNMANMTTIHRRTDADTSQYRHWICQRLLSSSWPLGFSDI